MRKIWKRFIIRSLFISILTLWALYDYFDTGIKLSEFSLVFTWCMWSIVNILSIALFFINRKAWIKRNDTID